MKKLLIFAFAVFSFAACTQNDVEELSANRADVPETLTVGFEGGDDTRIQLNEEQKTVWTKGDVVSVFYFSNANQKWQYQGETGERVGRLKRVEYREATAETTYNVVVYPYSDNYFLNPRTCAIHATLPAVQHYAEDSYGVGDNLMVSQSEFTQFTLKNVCGWLKIQLTGNGEKVQSITLRGNNEEQLAGLIYVDTATAESILVSEMGGYDDMENSVGGGLMFEDSIFTEITLNCGEGVELGAESKAFYIAVPPQTFEQGITVDIVCDGYKPMTLTTTSELVIERNHIKPMESVAFAAEASAEPSFTLKSPSSITALAAGGQAIIGYNLENPVEGVNVEATADVDWISITEIDTDRKRIYYYVTETDTRNERTGVITATYGEYGSFTVTVTQKGGSPTLNVFFNNNYELEYEATTMTIAYEVKFPNNGVELAHTIDYLSPEGAADWITDFTITVEEAEGDDANEEILKGYVTFNVTANEAKGDRVAKVILSYGENQTWALKLTQKDNMLEDVVMNVTEVHAMMSDQGKTWVLTFIESDPLLGNPMTDIVISLKTANVRYLTSGTYVKYKRGEGFREGTYDEVLTERSGSVYRYNVSGYAAAIGGDDREFTIEVNEVAQTAKISAHFITKQKNTENEKWNDVNVIIEWEGNVSGFAYADPSEEVTEWTSFSIVKSDNSQANHTWNRIDGKGKNGTTVIFDLYSPTGEEYVLPAGEYKVCYFTENKMFENFICDKGDPSFAFASKVNGYGLKSGTVTVEDVDGGQKKVTYNLVDINGIDLKGTYTGTL